MLIIVLFGGMNIINGFSPATATLTLDHYNGGALYLANWVKGTKHDALLSVKIRIIGEKMVLT